MATIAIVHIGLAGHLGPANRLGAVLARQGHRVVAWAPEQHRDQIVAAGAELHPHDPVPRRAIFGGLPGFTASLAAASHVCAGDLIEQLFADGVELVIHDCHALWGRVAADFLGVPRIVSDPLFPISAAGTSVPPGPVRSLHAGSEAFPGGLEGALRHVEASRVAIARKWGVDIGDWHAAMHSVGEVTASYTIPEILGKAAPPSGWRCIGPLMDAGPPRAGTSDRPLVYVALGTFFNYTPESFKAAIDALSGEPVDVVVSTGRGYVSAADLEPLPPNVSVYDFVDSRELLARACVHVTHGGCSSVHESLLAGVPMVCIPQGSDHALWAARLVQLGVAETVPTTPTAIREAVRRLLEEDAPAERARDLGERLASYDGERRVAELVGETLGQEVGVLSVSSSSSRGRLSRPSATGTS